MAKQRNSSIDIFRLICAIFIIMGHTYIFYDINQDIAFWTSRAIPRITVPFFLCVSGYFYIRGLIKGNDTFIKQIKGILKVYTFWTIIYYMLSFVLVIKNNESVIVFLKQRIKYFFFDGSYYHFWYFPAIIYTFIIASLFYKFGKMKGIKILAYLSLVIYFIFFIGTSYIHIGQSIPLLKNLYSMPDYSVIRGILGMGLPFFMVGYFLNILENWYEKFSPKTSCIIFVIVYLGYIAEAIYAKNASSLELAGEDLCVAITLLPTLFFFFVMLLKHPMTKYSKASEYCRRMSNYVYYIHPLFITCFEVVAGIIGITISNTPMFILVTISVFISGHILIKINNKFSKMFI